jgi:hypothetical protein
MRKLTLLAVVAVLQLCCISLWAVNEAIVKPFTIGSKSATSMDIRFEVPEYSIAKEVASGQVWDKISVAGSGYLMESGLPELPVLTTYVAIPNHGSVSLELVNAHTKVVQHIIPYPSQGGNADHNPKGISVNESFYRGSGLYPQEVVINSDPQILRDFRLIAIQIQPFAWNAETKELEVREQVDFRLNFSDTPGVNELDGPQIVSASFEHIYESMILNFDDYRSAMLANTPPKYLMIYGNYTDASFLSSLNNFVLWKKQKGADVTLVSTATTGTTKENIKSYIQGLYDVPNTRPDYVVLIGDIGGSFPIPSYTETWSTLNGHGDYPYTHLAGVDYLGDLFIGRISAESTAQLDVILGKTYLYEKDIVISAASWLNRMLLVGDTSSSGQGCKYTMKNILDLSKCYNPDYTYYEYYSDANSSNINYGINQGVGFFWYRGWIGMSGWTPTTSLVNSFRLPHAIIVTCATGNFYSGESTTEKFVRSIGTSNGTGAVTAIGMETSHTNPLCNNTLEIGMASGIFTHGMRSMGEALLNGKLFLSQQYGVSHEYGANYSAHWCNLIGDPTMEVFTGVPDTFSSNAADSVAAGLNYLDLTILNSASQTVEGACVTITQNGSILARAYTNSNGRAYLSTSTSLLAGYAIVTVSKHDYKPLVKSILVSSTLKNLNYISSVIDDNTSGSSSGNGNGIVNSGETIELTVSIKNSTSISYRNISATFNCSDSYITLTTVSTTFPNAAYGVTVTGVTPLVFSVNAACPNNHKVTLVASGSSDNGSWSTNVPITIYSPDLNHISYTVTGTDAYLQAGETAAIYTTASNNGAHPAAAVYGILRSLSYYVVVNDSLKSYGDIGAGASASNSASPFSVTARAIAIEGMLVPMQIYFYNSTGYHETVPFSLTIGNVDQADPLGQDAYGYFIYDVSDVNYQQCPTYSWIGIAQPEGGSGTLMGFTDSSVDEEGDSVGAVSTIGVTLPFSFKFYGLSYSQITVCSNGFIAMGSTENGSWRNCSLPGNGAPSPMIAPFWDDMITGDGGVYYWYNSTSHYFVVEWYNMKNGFDQASIETFEVILYDPAYYPTGTGDGPVKIQYNTFHNVDYINDPGYVYEIDGDGNYSTVGIQNRYGNIGLQYTFNNVYPAAAQPLSNGKALYITTPPLLTVTPSLWINQTVLVDTNGNGYAEPGENLDVRLTIGNLGTTAAANVNVTISESDTYISITGSTASFGTIAGLGSGINTSGLNITVSPSCPNNYEATVSATITATGYTFNRTFTITVRKPILGFGSITVSDPSPGNSNGILDPGETVTVYIPLNNTGLVASTSGTATLTSATIGITINDGADTFTAIAASGTATLSFNLTASGTMSNGTLASLVFSATAGSVTAGSTVSVEVGAPLVMTIGSGTGAQTYPLDRYYNYGGHEAIYLASELGGACQIKSMAYYKSSGTDVADIQAVTIYMKNTTESVLATGVYSTTGYTQVFSGNFPNTTTTGWMEINLSSLFEYNGISNLAILVIKGNQQWISNYPLWTCSTTSTARSRQDRSDTEQPSSLTSSTNLPNLRLKYFPLAAILYPPQNLAATSTHGSVTLTWSAPVSGSPTGYKIYKNSSLLTTLAALTYTDTAVTDGITYSYYLTASYSGVESSATFTVTATPNTVAPTNLTATTSHTTVLLSWTAALGNRSEDAREQVDRNISGYRVYRNSVAITNLTGTSYQDTGLTDGITYTYYVSTMYANPAGESAASNIITATPNMAAPSNLSATPGNTFVNLSWTAATGLRTDDSRASSDRSISGYRIYRNSVALTTVTGTLYQDTGLTNGVSYSYYVTTVYTNPAGESAASNTVDATPDMAEYVTLGSGTSASATYMINPICNNFNSVHSQSIYTASELAALGIVGPVTITELGFYVITSPNVALQNYKVRMKHVSASDVSSWISATDTDLVYTNASYMPVSGGFDLRQLTTPFIWNGIDNILVDTSFGMNSVSSSTGSIQYTSITNSYRWLGNDSVNQSNIFTGGTLTARRPNIKLSLSSINLTPPVVTITKVPTGIRLSWPVVNGATRYLVYSSNQIDSGFGTPIEVSANEYIDTSANPFRFYYVKAATAAREISR